MFQKSIRTSVKSLVFAGTLFGLMFSEGLSAKTTIITSPKTVTALVVSNSLEDETLIVRGTTLTIVYGLNIGTAQSVPFRAKVVIEDGGIIKLNSSASAIIFKSGNLELQGGRIEGGRVHNYGGFISGYGTVASPVNFGASTKLPDVNYDILATSADPLKALTFTERVNDQNQTLIRRGQGLVNFNNRLIDSSGTIRVRISLEEGKTNFNVNVGGDMMQPVLPLVSVRNNAELVMNFSQNLAALTVSNNARVTLAAGQDKVLKVREKRSQGERLEVHVFDPIHRARLDLMDNDLVIDAFDATDLANAKARLEGSLKISNIESPYGDLGLTSSKARESMATRVKTALGMALNADLKRTEFSGMPVTSSTIFVKYTYAGDANLSGSVNIEDYFKIDRGFIQQLKGWYNGDFNHSGSVDADDYFIIDSNFVSGAPTL